MSEQKKEEEDLKIYRLGILGIRYFSSMLPSMPKGKIISMNANGMGSIGSIAKL